MGGEGDGEELGIEEVYMENVGCGEEDGDVGGGEGLDGVEGEEDLEIMRVEGFM